MICEVRYCTNNIEAIITDVGAFCYDHFKLVFDKVAGKREMQKSIGDY
jgi:hypothetical protein